MAQGERYIDLAARAGERRLDSSYRAAFYLLSHDPELSRAARKYISINGIDFTSIKKATREFDEISRQVVDIAHNLFSWSSKCKVSPFDISRLGYPYMELTMNAIFIAADQAELVFEQGQDGLVKLSVDMSPYQNTISIHRHLQKLNDQMLAEQLENDEEMER